MEVPDYEYLRYLLKRVITREHKVIDFYYDWCNTKPNIKPNDIIYRNNYGIKYDGDDIWLNRKYCNGELNNYNNGINKHNKMGNVYISKNNLVPEHSMPKAIKDENSRIEEINIIHHQINTEGNSLAPQYSSSNIFNYNLTNKEA